MSATIYRFEGCHRTLVAEFRNSDDALRCFKSMAYNLNERLIMVSDGRSSVSPPSGCRCNGNSEYVLFPTFRTDQLRDNWDR